MCHHDLISQNCCFSFNRDFNEQINKTCLFSYGKTGKCSLDWNVNIIHRFSFEPAFTVNKIMVIIYLCILRTQELVEIQNTSTKDKLTTNVSVTY